MAVLPVFAGLVVALTLLQLDFLRDHGWSLRSSEMNYPSGLARGPLGVGQMINFALLGLLTAVFLRGFRTQLGGRMARPVAVVALGAFSLGALLSVAPTDLPGEDATWLGAVHGFAFLLLVLGALIGFVAAGLALRRNGDWAGYWVFSIATMAAMLVAVFLPLDQYASFLFFALLLLWFGVMGWRLWRLGSSAPAADDEGSRPPETRRGKTDTPH